MTFNVSCTIELQLYYDILTFFIMIELRCNYKQAKYDPLQFPT